ncbi:MAG TPA: LacI family DNA-binding transcriptional regulator [Chloroflexota bacterium]|nr:LacI family DNA-binding transcriptional regulator [Chloroflexota bacterium]
MAASTIGECSISTIEDVARLAGVSRGSVSNVLTGKVRMRDATRERVLEAARTLGYRPNRLASALASGRYPSIALLTADITNLVNADIVKAVEAVCTPRAYTVTICHTDKDVDRERAHLDDLLGHRAAGLIAKAEGAETARYRRLLDAGTRIVLIDNPILDLDLPIVRLDRPTVTRQALSSLAAAGHERIGAIVTDSPLPPGTIPTTGVLADRFIAQPMVKQCAAELGLGIAIEARPLRSLADGRDAMLALLNRDRPPTAVFATTWLHTLGMLSVVNRMQAEERNRLGLIGAGVAEYLDAIAPWLSYVEIPAREQGRVAIELLFELIDGADTPLNRDIVLPLRLVERASTAARAAVRTA